MRWTKYGQFFIFAVKFAVKLPYLSIVINISLCHLQAFAFHPIFQDEPLTPGKIFPSILLSDILSMPIQLFPVLVNFIVNARASTGKIVEFLGAVEVDNKRHHLQQACL